MRKTDSLSRSQQFGCLWDNGRTNHCMVHSWVLTFGQYNGLSLVEQTRGEAVHQQHPPHRQRVYFLLLQLLQLQIFFEAPPSECAETPELPPGHLLLECSEDSGYVQWLMRKKGQLGRCKRNIRCQTATTTSNSSNSTSPLSL